MGHTLSKYREGLRRCRSAAQHGPPEAALVWGRLAESYRLLIRYEEAERIGRALPPILNDVAYNALDGATPSGPKATPLPDLLSVLVRTTIEYTHGDARAAFYLADSDRKALHHVTGMPPAYARHVDGFAIGLDSLACGLCASVNRPVVTRDVTEEPRWRPWLWLPRQFDYRACWSFPIESPSGKILGSFAMYYRQPTQATARELDLAAAMTRTAAAIIGAQ